MRVSKNTKEPKKKMKKASNLENIPPHKWTLEEMELYLENLREVQLHSREVISKLIRAELRFKNKVMKNTLTMFTRTINHSMKIRTTRVIIR